VLDEIELEVGNDGQPTHYWTRKDHEGESVIDLTLANRLILNWFKLPDDHATGSDHKVIEWEVDADKQEEYQLTKVLAKQKQRDKSTTTIAIKKRTAAIDSRRRIDPEASVPAPARPQEEGAHRNPHNGVGSRKGLAENATDATRRPTSKRRRGLRGLPHRSDDRIQSEREE
jgi:hypothetical protein